MKLVEFPEQTIIIAKDQPEYLPLPAHIEFDQYGTVTCCWELTLWERIKLLFSGRIWHQILAFRQPLQPQRLMIDKPALSRMATHERQ